MSFKRDTLTTFFTRIGVVLVLFARSVLTARILLPAGKGLLGIIMLVPAVLQTIGDMGISMANVYLLGRKRASVPAIVGCSLLISVLAGVALIGLFSAASRAGLIEPVLKDAPRSAVHLAVLALPFLLFSQYAASILQGQRKMGLYNFAKSAHAVLFFFAILVALVWLKRGVGEATIGYYVSAIGAFLVALYLVLPRKRPVASIDWRVVREAVSFGVRGHPGSVMEFLNLRLNMFLVSYFLDFSQVGYYVVAVSVTEVILHLPRAVVAALFPRVSSIDQEKSAELGARAVRNAFALSLASAAGLLVLNVPFVLLVYGRAYAPSTLPVFLLLPGVVAASLSVLLKGCVVGLGRPFSATIASFSALTVNVALNLLLIPRLGIAGAALASTASYTCQAVLLLAVFHRLSGVPIKDVLLVKASDLEYYKTGWARAISRLSPGSGSSDS